jgi:hypothetical protein
MRPEAETEPLVRDLAPHLQRDMKTPNSIKIDAETHGRRFAHRQCSDRIDQHQLWKEASCEVKLTSSALVYPVHNGLSQMD